MNTKSVEKPGTRLSALLPSLRLRLFPRMGALLLLILVNAAACDSKSTNKQEKMTVDPDKVQPPSPGGGKAG